MAAPRPSTHRGTDMKFTFRVVFTATIAVEADTEEQAGEKAAIWAQRSCDVGAIAEGNEDEIKVVNEQVADVYDPGVE